VEGEFVVGCREGGGERLRGVEGLGAEIKRREEGVMESSKGWGKAGVWRG